MAATIRRKRNLRASSCLSTLSSNLFIQSNIQTCQKLFMQNNFFDNCFFRMPKNVQISDYAGLLAALNELTSSENLTGLERTKDGKELKNEIGHFHRMIGRPIMSL